MGRWSRVPHTFPMSRKRALVVGPILRVMPDGSFEAIPIGPCEVEVQDGDAVTIHWRDGSATYSRDQAASYIGKADLLFVDELGR